MTKLVSYNSMFRSISLNFYKIVNYRVCIGSGMETQVPYVIINTYKMLTLLTNGNPNL